MSIIKEYNKLEFVNSNHGVSHVPEDKYTEDHNLKYKVRTVNLIKYNPELFTNRGNFGYVYGGEKSLLMTLGCATLGLLYRRRANFLRNVPTREGIWYNTAYFLFGASIGAFYSTCFFVRWQVVYNEYIAHFLMKRYKGSQDLHAKNIWRFRNIENKEECYNFSNSYANSFHL